MDYPVTNRNKVIRGSKKATYNQEEIYGILDSLFVCHVGFLSHGKLNVLPTSYGRRSNTLYLHGAASSAMLAALPAMDEVCVEVTNVNGLVLATTMFNTGLNYRSVVMYGPAREVTDEEERIEALEIISENIIPGRWQEVKLGKPNEIKATKVVAFEINLAAAKVRTGPPQEDNDNDKALWSGEIPLKTVAQKAITATGTTLPASVAAYEKEHGKCN